MKNIHIFRSFLPVFLILVIGGIGFGFDIEWVFDDDGFTNYILDSYSPASAELGLVGASDPDLTLILGKRYKVTITHPTAHPLDILAKGSSSSGDTILLSMASGVDPPLESDPDINWVHEGASVTFTMSQSLLDAMNELGKNPGYRCWAHRSSMRGDFIITGLPLDDPIPAPIPESNIKVELLLMADGLTAPVHLQEANDGTGRLFIVDQDGQIFIKKPSVSGLSLFLDVSDRLVDLGFFGSKDEDDFDERGLLGMAFHPGFANLESPGYRKLYTYTSEPVKGPGDFTVVLNEPGTVFNHQAVITEWTVDDQNPDVVDVLSRREIMRVDEPQFNHDGGMVAFGPDGYLYVGFGDGGGSNDTTDGHGTFGNGQDITTILGSIIRINPLDPSVTLGSPDIISINGKYRVPTDNPFIGDIGVDEIYAWGFRNPYRFSFDKVTGDLIVGDVGQNFIEEVNIVVNGANYGWNDKEGIFRFDPLTGNITDNLFGIPDDLTDPVIQYDHNEGLSVIGGYVYHGSELPDLTGVYVFGDFSKQFFAPNGRLFTGNLVTGDINELMIGDQTLPLGLFLKGLGQDLDGEIYVLGSTALGPFGTAGVVYKIVQDICNERLASDLNDDCVTDFEDFGIFAAEWLQCTHKNNDLCGQ